ncbi:MAG: hypothetical protein IMZ57_01080 [Acidobacteria bacterium]|nr:hypothetical protein [Acidobacteriota bacterium]
MATTPKSEALIPVICIDPSSVTGAEMFNLNSWPSDSKGVIQSCWAEYSVLHHCVAQISDMCNDAERLLAISIKTIQQQWHAERFDLERVAIFSEQPDLHIRIEAFFSGVKALLDLLVQLLSTEKIVSEVIDGFHRTGDIYGGRVLNTLKNNALKNKKDAAAKLDALISEHKKLWIDQVVLARDQLIHPDKGTHQLMFRLVFEERANALVCIKAYPPEIGATPMHIYTQDILKQATVFSMSYLGLLRERALSNNSMEPTR